MDLAVRVSSTDCTAVVMGEDVKQWAQYAALWDPGTGAQGCEYMTLRSERCGYGVLGPVHPLNKLAEVESLKQDRCDMTPNRFLKALFHHWDECDASEVVEDEMRILMEDFRKGGGQVVLECRSTAGPESPDHCRSCYNNMVAEHSH